jgi:hypothetical protein
MNSLPSAKFFTSYLVLSLVALTHVSNTHGQVPERQLALKRDVETRLAKGEAAPAKGEDPGDPIMQCSGVQPVPFRVSADVLRAIGGELVDMFPILVGSRSVICANSEEGARVLAYREWYCNGKDAACVLAAWSKGEPTLGAAPKNDVNFDLGAIAKGTTTPVAKVRMTLSRVYK